MIERLSRQVKECESQLASYRYAITSKRTIIPTVILYIDNDNDDDDDDDDNVVWVINHILNDLNPFLGDNDDDDVYCTTTIFI